MKSTRGATRIDAPKTHPLLIQFWGSFGVFPGLLLISNALSVGDAFSLTDFPQKPSLRKYYSKPTFFCQPYFFREGVGICERIPLFHQRNDLLAGQTAELFCELIKCGILIQTKASKDFVAHFAVLGI